MLAQNRVPIPSSISELQTAVIILDVLALYVLAGATTALGFVTFGIKRVLPAGTPVTVGARVLLWPGAALLWPYMLIRLTKASVR